MTYSDGVPISLGDVVRVSVPGGTSRARVVMLGDSYEHLDIDEQFLSWGSREKALESSHVVVEWLDENPFVHSDSRFAPVGNYMFSPADEALERDLSAPDK